MTEQLFNDVIKWQRKTFTEANALSKLCHLEKEVEEVKHDLNLKNPHYEDIDNNIREEYADCFLLLFGSAAAYGMSFDDITNAIQAKFEKNKARKWGKPDENGVVEHLKE